MFMRKQWLCMYIYYTLHTRYKASLRDHLCNHAFVWNITIHFFDNNHGLWCLCKLLSKQQSWTNATMYDLHIFWCMSHPNECSKCFKKCHSFIIIPSQLIVTERTCGINSHIIYWAISSEMAHAYKNLGMAFEVQFNHRWASLGRCLYIWKIQYSKCLSSYVVILGMTASELHYFEISKMNVKTCTIWSTFGEHEHS